MWFGPGSPAAAAATLSFAHLVPLAHRPRYAAERLGKSSENAAPCSQISTRVSTLMMMMNASAPPPELLLEDAPEGATRERGAAGVLAIPRHERKAARRTRSFRRRQAPITRRQRQHLRDLWPKHGLAMDFKQRWDFDAIFSTASGAPVTLDIGFGSGESLLGMAEARPNERFVGIEVHKPGVAKALASVEAEGLPNVKVALGDVITALCDHVEDRTLDECCVFFPEPFPLARDTDRRLFRPLLLSLLASKMRPGGILNVTTDVEGYAEHVIRVMSPRLVSPSLADEIQGSGGGGGGGGVGSGGLAHKPLQESAALSSREPTGERVTEEAFWVGGETSERPPWRPHTVYEQKAEEAGRRVRDFRYRLVLPQAQLPP